MTDARQIIHLAANCNNCPRDNSAESPYFRSLAAVLARLLAELKAERGAR